MKDKLMTKYCAAKYFILIAQNLGKLITITYKIYTHLKGY